MYCDCGNPVENRDTGKCGSCSQAARKAAKVKVKVVAPFKKVTQKKADELAKYPSLKRQYIAINPNCEASLIDCTMTPSQIHHCSISAKNFLNTDTWLAVCSNCHKDVENMPSEQRRGIRMAYRLNLRTIKINTKQKHMSYKAGQQLVCINDKGWSYPFPRYKGFWPFKKEIRPNGPIKDEIVTFVCCGTPGYIKIMEYTVGEYQSIGFSPVADISELEEILNTNKETV